MRADLIARAAFDGVMACWCLFAVTFWLRKRPPRAREAKRDRSSYAGILLQAAGYFAVWFSPMLSKQFLPLSSGPEWLAWVIAALAVLIAAVSVGLVNWAVRRLGKQWAIGARLVEDHVLIEDGPYRFVRNPIYTGLFGLLVATGLALQRWIPLALAVVLFAIGSHIRIRAEDRLLREAFGQRFDEYARRVPALIPGVY